MNYKRTFARLKKMKQHECIKKLAKEGHDFEYIENFLHEEFGKQALSRASIYRWMATVKFSQKAFEKKEPCGQPLDTQLLHRISEELEKMPFASSYVIADNLNEVQSTVYRYLTKHLGLVYKLSYWVPHSLNYEQKKKRSEGASMLFRVLCCAFKQNWRSIITGDQSWFRLSYDHTGKWCLPNEKRPDGDGSVISIQKVMVTIIWGVYGFYIVDFLEPGKSFNSSYFNENILNKLIDMKEEIWSESRERKIWLHLDNCRVHNSGVVTDAIAISGFKRAPHPPYSPDIAPSDFFLFGYIKEKLKGKWFESIDDLKESILEILGKIDEETRRRVFKEWLQRCENLANSDGSYLHK